VWQARARAAPISETCATGGLARVPLADGWDADCDGAVLAGQTDAALLRCGGADELAYACSGISSQEVAVTRHRLLLAEDTPAVATVTWQDAPEQGQAVHADALDVVGCVVSEPESWRGGSGGSGGSGGTAPSSGASTSYWGGPAADAPAPSVHADTSATCAGSTEPEPEWWEPGGGGGDAPARDDDEATCTGDSSEAADSDEATCSGDSSDAEYEEATCAGDSSESADYEGDTCSGDAGADASSDCSVSAPRPRRPRLSVLTLALVAAWLPIRRFGRQRR
jgi:hypothetical protein